LQNQTTISLFGTTRLIPIGLATNRRIGSAIGSRRIVPLSQLIITFCALDAGAVETKNFLARDAGFGFNILRMVR
jgi:hypothetical protein